MHIFEGFLKYQLVYCGFFFFDYVWLDYSDCYADVLGVFLFFFYPVRLPPLKWNVSEAEHQFTIKVDPPAVLKSSWKYRVEYTECNEEKVSKTQLLDDNNKNHYCSLTCFTSLYDV